MSALHDSDPAKDSEILQPSSDKIVWEHGRRNFQLRRDGKTCIVCPIGGTEVAGTCIFGTTPEETKSIYDEDPCVKAGIFVCDIYPTHSFAGDALSKLSEETCQ